MLSQTTIKQSVGSVAALPPPLNQVSQYDDNIAKTRYGKSYLSTVEKSVTSNLKTIYLSRLPKISNATKYAQVHYHAVHE